MQVTFLDEQVAALRRGDLSAAGRLNGELVRNGRRVRTSARRFGFRVCGGA
jgi:hypothetical protein